MLGLALGVRFLGLLLDNPIDFLDRFLLVLVVFEGASIASLPAHLSNILVGVLRPLLHVDFLALVKVTLDAP